jgi:hypothetical protein
VEPGLETLVLTNSHGVGQCFATPGTWDSVIEVGTLVVSMPEPDILACVLLGLALTGLAVHRRPQSGVNFVNKVMQRQFFDLWRLSDQSSAFAPSTDASKLAEHDTRCFQCSGGCPAKGCTK